MKAAVLYNGERSLKIEDVKNPELKPGHVRVTVKACGVCGSDVHLVCHNTLHASSYPRIPGHESSGVVKECGENANIFKPGDRVVIGNGTCCGECKACKSGRWNLCLKVGVLGFDSDGAYAEEIVIDERYLTRLPDNIPFAEGAILADAVSTPYHALKYSGRLMPGERLAVIGCGGLGIQAVLIGRALGAEVVALDVDPGALDNAHKAGAHEVIDLKGKASPGKILKEKGLDVLADFSGYYKNLGDCVRAMNPGGRMVMVGIGRDALNFAIPAALIFKQIQVCGSYGSDVRAIPELIEMVSSGKLNVSGSISSVHKLDDAQQCLEDLDHRRGNPIRFVLTP